MRMPQEERLQFNQIEWKDITVEKLQVNMTRSHLDQINSHLDQNIVVAAAKSLCI